MNLVAKDPIRGDATSYQTEIEVPHFEEGKLGASSLILADTIEKLPSTAVAGAMFAIAGDKVRPRVGGAFAHGETMGVYLQIYNFAPDATTGKPAGSVEYVIERSGTGEKVVDVTEQVGSLPDSSASQVTVEKLFLLAQDGAFTMKVIVTDRIGKQTVERQENFTVSAQ